VIVRRELASDAPVVAAVHADAFRRPDAPDADPVEVGLLAELRTCAGWIPELSLVATRPDGDVVGHVVCTQAWVDDVAVVGLGPIGVRPEAQGVGIGNAMVHAVLGAADALGTPLVGLLGSPCFYGRFGFVTSESLGVTAPDPAWGEHFQVRPLATWTAGVRGAFRYAPPFEDLP